jgi:hypothetical protein
MSARAVVAGGQPELQLMPCELPGGGKELLANRLRLQRRVRGAERRRVHCKNEPDLLCMSREQLPRARTVPIMHEQHGIGTREPRVPVQGRIYGKP